MTEGFYDIGPGQLVYARRSPNTEYVHFEDHEGHVVGATPLDCWPRVNCRLIDAVDWPEARAKMWGAP